MKKNKLKSKSLRQKYKRLSYKKKNKYSSFRNKSKRSSFRKKSKRKAYNIKSKRKELYKKFKKQKGGSNNSKVLPGFKELERQAKVMREARTYQDGNVEEQRFYFDLFIKKINADGRIQLLDKNGCQILQYLHTKNIEEETSDRQHITLMKFFCELNKLETYKDVHSVYRLMSKIFDDFNTTIARLNPMTRGQINLSNISHTSGFFNVMAQLYLSSINDTSVRTRNEVRRHQLASEEKKKELFYNPKPEKAFAISSIAYNTGQIKNYYYVYNAPGNNDKIHIVSEHGLRGHTAGLPDASWLTPLEASKGALLTIQNSGIPSLSKQGRRTFSSQTGSTGSTGRESGYHSRDSTASSIGSYDIGIGGKYIPSSSRHVRRHGQENSTVLSDNWP